MIGGMDENDSKRKKIDRYWNWAQLLALIALIILQQIDLIDPFMSLWIIGLISVLGILRDIPWWLNRRDHSRTAKRPPDPP